MPVIKAYKSGNSIIPVSDAKVVNAFLCPFTNDVFTTKKKYVNHLAKYRVNVIHKNIISQNINKKIAQLNDQTSWKNVISWIENNSRYIMENAKRNRSFNERWPNINDFKITITLLDITYINKVSNSHNAPRNHPTNWHNTPDLPTGYPGWNGRIEFKLSHSIPVFSSDLFQGTGIHLGTGGGISKERYGYSVTMFEADWPGMQKKRLLDILSNVRDNSFLFGKPDYFAF